MIELTAIVKNAQGIHCRPSTAIASAVRDYAGKMSVHCGSEVCDPRSVMQVMALGLEQGESVQIRVSGGREDDFGHRLVALFETRFDFPPREAGA